MSYQPPVTPGYSGQPPSVWPPKQPAPRKSRAVPILVGALVVLVAAVAALTYALIGKSATTPRAAMPAASPAVAIFDQARGDCRITTGYEVGDAGRTLEITVGGPGMANDDLTCLVGELHVPDAVMQHILSTRALDGQQTDSWPGYTARWTYHPDDGLQMTVRLA